MNVKFIAFDSFGVKSTCTQVRLNNFCITIDPGIAIETASFPLSMDKRLSLVYKYKKKIEKSCMDSDVIIITHYHYDHFIPDDKLYENKLLLIKDPKNNINRSQFKRAKEFLSLIKGKTKKIEISDNKEFNFGKIKINFSEPLWHGVNKSTLGYVLLVKIVDENTKLLFSSDLVGIYQEEYADLIIKENPDILIIDGPATYLLGYLVSYYNLAKNIINLCKIIDHVDSEIIILDHHLLRDYRYRDLLFEVYTKAKKLNKNVLTAAEYYKMKPKVLEGYEKSGPTKWKKWEVFTKKEIINVIQNAIENKLIDKKWLNKAKEL